MEARHRILLVEDAAAVRGVIRAALEGEGYRVLPSDRPVGPLDVRQLRASLVVLDLMLGGEPDGYGWLEALRASPWTARLPVLVCSAYLAPGAPAAARVRALADAALPKPFELDALLAAVAGCLAADAPHGRGPCPGERRRAGRGRHDHRRAAQQRRRIRAVPTERGRFECYGSNPSR